MSEQERVDLERLRRLSMAEIAALLAVVDAALAWDNLEPGCDHALVMALEPFTPAGEAAPGRERGATDEWRTLFEGRAAYEKLSVGRVFNERMQADDRARRLAALGIVVNVPQSGPIGARADDVDVECNAFPVDPPVSDGVSSGAGGRSVSCARADGPQIPSGPAPLPARVEALVEALRYYAKPETYRQVGWCDDLFAVVEEDSGEKARAALAEWEQA